MALYFFAWNESCTLISYNVVAHQVETFTDTVDSMNSFSNKDIFKHTFKHLSLKNPELYLEQKYKPHHYNNNNTVIRATVKSHNFL